MFTLFLSGCNLLSIGLWDDYLIEDDFMIESQAFQKPFHDNPSCDYTAGTTSSWDCDDGTWATRGICNNLGCSEAEIKGNDLILQGSSSGGDATATYKANLKNKDIKFRVELQSNGGGVNFGSHNVLSGNSGFHLIELIKDVVDEDKFLVLDNGEAVKEIIVSDSEANLEFYCNKKDGGYGGPSGYIKVDWIKSKPYFSCEVSNNEVVISDFFGEGSTYDIHDLTYEATKFCPVDYPAVVRDYSEIGIKSDVRGSIIEGLTKGKSFTVPSMQSHEIRYITTYKDDMGVRCEINEVYDTQLKECVSKIFEQDYIIQMATSCDQVTCNEEYSEYCEMRDDVPVCVRPYKVVEKVRDKIIIKVGSDQHSFENEAVIGNKQITTSIPEFTCNPGGEDHNAPFPDKDCWNVDVNYDGESYEMKEGDKVDLNDYLNLELKSITAHYEYDLGKVDSYSNLMILTIDFDGVTSKIIDSNYYVVKDSSREMCFDIENKLGVDFSKDQSGYSILQTVDLQNIQKPREIREKDIPGGKTQFCIPIDTEIYGISFFEINPYFKIDDELFFDDEEIVYNYEVVDEIPGGYIDIIDTPVDQKSCSGWNFFCRIYYWIKNLF